jgi:riboflavin biosynthesis pyrimidine reductase
VGVEQLLPTGVAGELDDAALHALYLPPADRPWLRVNFVASVDGAATVDGRSRGLGSRADKQVFGLLRGYPDALLVGAGTLRTEGYGALKKHNERGAYPRLVVVSGRLDLAPEHPALADAPVRPILLTRTDAPDEAATALAPVADVVRVGEKAVDLAAGVAELHQRGLSQVLCEGGPTLFGALIAADLVDEVCLTVSPLLAGAGAGRISAGDPVPGGLPRDLVLRHVLTGDGALLLRYTRAD